MKRIKVLIVDDSAMVRSILETKLSAFPEIEVVGKAQDAYVARDKIVFCRPDVITLDVEMPKMDGIEFLRHLMPQFPVPVIMVSALTGPNAKITLDALAYGAIDFVLKPSVRLNIGLGEMIDDLVRKIKMASTVDVSGWKDPGYRKSVCAKKPKVLEGSTDKVIAVGASTGGTVAITRILENLPEDIPGMIIVQHMPPDFTRLFAEKLNNDLGLSVKEAKDGDRLVRGQALIAPGGLATSIERSGGQYIARCIPGEKINGHCPSVDVLFDSVAEHAGPNSIGVLLTGMGKDGAEGLLRMKQTGAKTIAQDEASSIVFGMPREAYKIGAVDRLDPLASIPAQIVFAVNEINRKKNEYVV